MSKYQEYHEKALAILVRHDVEHHVVGRIHGLLANRREVVNALVNVVVNDALSGGYLMVLHGEKRGKKCGRHPRANLYAARWLGPVANHAREVGHHVLYGSAHTAIVATHEIDNATARARACHHAATKSRQRAKALLDIDGGEMREG